MGREGVREVNDFMIAEDLRRRAPIYVLGLVRGSGPESRRLLRFLGTLEDRYIGTVMVRCMRGNEHPSFLRKLGIGPLPALAIWCKGVFFARWFGVVDPNALARVVEMLSDAFDDETSDL